MTTVAVDPADLRSAVEQVRTAAERVFRSVATHGDGLVVPAQRGWQAVAALGPAAQAWADHLSALAAGLEAMAVDIGVLTDAAVGADREAAGRWRAEAAR
jgi:hypothetical protein